VQDFLPGEKITISIVYGSEKRDWLEPLVQQFNEARNETSEGKIIVVEATALGSLARNKFAQSGTSRAQLLQIWNPSGRKAS